MAERPGDTKRIWIVCVGEPLPTDPERPRLLRAGILARMLTEKGHEVTWWTSTMDHYQKRLRADRTVVIEGTECGRLILLHGIRYTKNTSLRRIINHVQIANEFKRHAGTETRPDVVLVSMPTIELARAAVSYAKELGIPSIVDIRDLWPDIIKEAVPRAARPLLQPLFFHWEADLQYALKQATALVGVTEPFLEWGLRKAGRNKLGRDRVFHLATDPNLLDENPAAGDSRLFIPSETATEQPSAVPDELREALRPAPDLVTGCFAGTLSSRLDLVTILEAALILCETKKRKLRLIICGRGDLEYSIVRLARKSDGIIFLGWVGSTVLSKIHKVSDFAIVPHRPSTDFVNHYPNKLGESLRFGLPILTPLKGLTRTLLASEGVGIFYRAGDVSSARTALMSIIENISYWRSRKSHSLELFNRHFDPHAIYNSYESHILKIIRDFSVIGHH
ncbi:MAG: glycosyltransferase WbuB [Nitrospiraceae bacterium]|nr:MAG: glycosyltransferase WbuB [Nitrospiraceae bacterium]